MVPLISPADVPPTMMAFGYCFFKTFIPSLAAISWVEPKAKIKFTSMSSQT
jgi:hypothetical protein